MKTFETFKTDLNTLRTDLNTTTYRVEKVQELLGDLVEKLDGLYDQSVSNKDQAVDLVRDVEDIKPPQHEDRPLRSTHYRMLALLAHYGTMHRDHIAGIMGVKPETIAQYTHIVKHHGLADLQSRKGRVTLFSLADGVSEHNHFRT